MFLVYWVLLILINTKLGKEGLLEIQWGCLSVNQWIKDLKELEVCSLYMYMCTVHVKTTHVVINSKFLCCYVCAHF